MSKKIDWNKVRKHFPACNQFAYLMNASVTLLHEDVYKAIRSHVDHLYEKGFECFDALDGVFLDYRSRVSTLLEASPEDIALAPNTSYCMNLLATALKDQKSKPNVVMPEDEFPSSCLPWHHQGYEVRLIPSHGGRVSIEEILGQMDANTVAVIHSAVQFTTGFRQDLRRLGTEVKKKGVPFIVNATQGLGAFPISVKNCHISALTASAHKWMGAGCGASIFFASPALRSHVTWPMVGWMSVTQPWELKNEPPDIVPTAAAVELGTPNASILFALSAASKVVLDLGIENIAKRIVDLSSTAVNQLRAMNLEILSPRDDKPFQDGSCNSGIVTFAMKNPAELEKKLGEDGIKVSARRNGLRFSIHYFNNEEDIERAITSLNKHLA